MAAALIDQWIESQRADFVQRVSAAICLAAQSIYAEGTGVTGHAARAVLSTKIAQAPTAYNAAFSVMLAAQGVDHSSTDAQINTMVASVWNTAAGV